MTLCCRATLSVLLIVVCGRKGLSRTHAHDSADICPRERPFPRSQETSRARARRSSGRGSARPCAGQAVYTVAKWSLLTTVKRRLARTCGPSLDSTGAISRTSTSPEGIAVLAALRTVNRSGVVVCAPRPRRRRPPLVLSLPGGYFDQAKYKRELAEYQGSKLAVYRRSETADDSASISANNPSAFRTAEAYGVANSLAASCRRYCEPQRMPQVSLSSRALHERNGCLTRPIPRQTSVFSSDPLLYGSRSRVSRTTRWMAGMSVKTVQRKPPSRGPSAGL